MRIITHYFDWKGETTFATLLTLMKYSFGKQGIPLECIEMPVPKVKKRVQIVSNHEKLKEWNKVVQGAKEPVILLDTDMYCKGDFREVANSVNHIGITFRPKGQWPPVNGGFVVAKPTDESRHFFSEWVRIDGEMFRDSSLHQKWRDKWAGMNQASFGYLVEKLGLGSVVSELPCNPYNCVEPWTYWHAAKLIHIKGDLRKALFGKKTNRNRDQFHTLVGMLRVELAQMMQDENIKERYWICKDLAKARKENVWDFFKTEWFEIGEWGPGPRRFGVCRNRIPPKVMKIIPSVSEISKSDFELYLSRLSLDKNKAEE